MVFQPLSCTLWGDSLVLLTPRHGELMRIMLLPLLITLFSFSLHFTATDVYLRMICEPSSSGLAHSWRLSSACTSLWDSHILWPGVTSMGNPEEIIQLFLCFFLLSEQFPHDWVKSWPVTFSPGEEILANDSKLFNYYDQVPEESYVSQSFSEFIVSLHTSCMGGLVWWWKVWGKE